MSSFASILGQSTSNSQDIIHEVSVKEVLQTNSYTYLLVSENKKETWLAVNKITAKVGEKYYYEKWLLMKDFFSKELNRTFNEILFLGNLCKTKEELKTAKTNLPHSLLNQNTPSMGVKPPSEKIKTKINPIIGGITISELLSKKVNYSGKTVKIKGQITKFTPKILGKNWVHFQDGSDFNGKYELTVTVSSELKVGDVVILEGKVILNKDYGFGYSYDIIIENAKIIK